MNYVISQWMHNWVCGCLMAQACSAYGWVLGTRRLFLPLRRLSSRASRFARRLSHFLCFLPLRLAAAFSRLACTTFNTGASMWARKHVYWSKEKDLFWKCLWGGKPQNAASVWKYAWVWNDWYVPCKDKGYRQICKRTLELVNHTQGPDWNKSTKILSLYHALF